MARIEGVNLPRQKRIECGLTYIFGIGPKRAKDILTETGINPNIRVKDLTEEQAAVLQKATSQYRTEGDLRQQIRRDIARLKEIKSYRGSRHQKSLPVRGQRTKTNARTRKGPRGLAIAGKKKVSKK